MNCVCWEESGKTFSAFHEKTYWVDLFSQIGVYEAFQWCFEHEYTFALIIIFEIFVSSRRIVFMNSNFILH